MDKNPHIRKAINLIGGVVATQKALDLETYQTVQQWIAAGSVPAQYCHDIEKLTNGKVTRKQLHPKFWMKVWPELVTHKKAA